MFYTCVNRFGDNILVRFIDDAGNRRREKVKFKPTLFIRSDESQYTGLDGVPVAPVKFDSMKEAREFVDRYQHVDNFDIYGIQNYVSQFIYEAFPVDIQFDQTKMNITTIDIEVDSSNGMPLPEVAQSQITSIAIKSSLDDTFHLWGLKPYDTTKCEIGVPVNYRLCRNELDLIKSFLDYWNSPNGSPDIVTGWYSRMFDIPYLFNRISKIGGDQMAKQLSPWRVVNKRSVTIMGKSLDTYELYGIQQLDYMDLFQRFGFSYGKQESYKLDHIAHIVLGERKLSYEEYSGLHDLYENDHQKYLDYNLKDVQLVQRLDDKLGMINLTLTMAYRAGVNYYDVFGTTMIWDTIIYRYLMEKKVVVQPFEPAPKEDYPGGYVKDPHCGLHEWVCSFDLNSLYPSIIVQWNMSPETVLPAETVLDALTCLTSPVSADPETCLAANGVRFRRDKQGAIPEIVKQYYADRKRVKGKLFELKKQYEQIDGKDDDLEREIVQRENEQMAIKILLNSLYGALGNRFFRHYSRPMAEAVTITGQFVIQWAERALNEKLNSVLETFNKDYVIAIDTDSTYVNMAPVVKKFAPKNPVDFLDKVCDDVLQPVLNNAYQQLFERFNCYEPRLEMSREVIADRGIWTAKKRYILNVLDNEGVRYREPKLKIMGIEAIKSSTPAVCREALKELFKVIISGSEEKTQKAIQEFKDYFIKLPPHDMAFPRGVSEIDKWTDRKTIYKKGTPIHVRGSLLFNHYIKEHGLTNRYSPIQNGERIKFLYLKMPNPIRENVISFTDYLPQEFHIHQYVDSEMQFQKTFVDPIKPILDAIGWSVEKEHSLEDFFI